MRKKMKGLKCKKFLAMNLESLNKMMNDFLDGKDIIFRHVKIEVGRYAIDDNLKGELIDFSIFYEKLQKGDSK